MHKRPPRAVGIIVLMLLIASGGWWWYSLQSGAALRTADYDILASGTIEAEATSIAAEIGGIIRELPADEGAEVRQDDVLVRLDDALLTAQIKQAQAGVDTAQASLAVVLAGARPEDKRAAKATVDQAIAARDGAKKGWENAQAIRANPQELNARIATARADLEVLTHQVSQMNAVREATEANKDRVAVSLEMARGGYDVDTPFGKQHFATPSIVMTDLNTQFGLVTNQWWSAWESVNIALAARDGAERNLANLLDMRKDPIALDTQVDAAKAAYESAKAAVDGAQARLDALDHGATAEQIAIARAQVDLAQAGANILKTQLAKLTLRAPLSGVVTSRSAHVGEMATPGANLLTVAALDPVKLTVYIPVDQIGRISLGQPVEVGVDSWPGESFTGEVVYLSPRAEFTPKNVQTQKERVNTVFAVRIQLPNALHKLKPGMPADAIIRGN